MDALSLERQVCLWSLGLRIGPYPYTHTNCVLDSWIHGLFHGLFGSLIVLVVSVLSPSIVFNVYPITQRLLPGGRVVLSGAHLLPHADHEIHRT